MKLFIWLLLGFLVYLALRKKAKTSFTKTDHSAKSENMASASEADSSGETMVCCKRCKVHVPASEAVQRGVDSFCSVEHADLN